MHRFESFVADRIIMAPIFFASLVAVIYTTITGAANKDYPMFAICSLVIVVMLWAIYRLLFADVLISLAKEMASLREDRTTPEEKAKPLKASE